VHALGEGAIRRRHLRDPVEDRLQTVGLLGALLALGAQLGGTLLHRGALLGGEPLGRGRGLLGRHGRFLSGTIGGIQPLCPPQARTGRTVPLLDS
jgi:hypothetical protein